MELVRKILFEIEDKYKPGTGSIANLQIENYDMLVIAEHCDLLYQQGLIKNYEPQYGGNKLIFFAVGPLTYIGHDILDQVRNDIIWEKTKDEISEKKLPKTIEVITKIAGIFTGNVIKEING